MNSADASAPAFELTLEAAQAGEEWAWSRLYRNLVGPITGYLASRGGTDPDDLCSETLLQVARNINTFSGSESSFRSWVFVVAHRRLIDARRSEGRRAATTPFDPASNEPVGGNVEEEAIDDLVTKEIEGALLELTEDQRDVLALRVIGDLTLAETADVMGKTVGAVKALQRRGLAALRESLDAQAVSK